MITLDRLEQKLDVLLRRTEAIETVQDAIRFEAERDRKELAESQGKLLAALNEVQGLLLASEQQVMDLGRQMDEARKQILLLIGIGAQPSRVKKERK